MNRFYKTWLWVWIAVFCLPVTHMQAQGQKKVLFLGNSYIQVNNLPAMVASIAESMGDTMAYGSNTPGGCTFEMHCGNNSMRLICEGGWDVVVMQEQSQLPAFPIELVEEMVYPFARQLVDSVAAFNPDAEPMFFMTWGRKNGDTEFGSDYPMMSTYEGMDSLLYARYMAMAEQNNASVCPVGRVWHYLRDHYGEIELYQPDGSHPSMAGSYAAACAFYTLFFGRDPDSIAYDAGLGMSTARNIRTAVHAVVFDSLWQWQKPVPNGICDDYRLAEVSVFPNPAVEEAFLSLPKGMTAEVALIGMDGRRWWCQAEVNSSDRIRLAGLPQGLYFLRVATKNGMVVKKIVKR